jgi:hypothetical protein
MENRRLSRKRCTSDSRKKQEGKKGDRNEELLAYIAMYVPTSLPEIEPQSRSCRVLLRGVRIRDANTG